METVSRAARQVLGALELVLLCGKLVAFCVAFTFVVAVCVFWSVVRRPRQ